MNVDSSRFNSVAVPTVLAGVTTGAAGFLTARTVKYNKMTDKFANYMADGFEKRDRKMYNAALSLDKINPFITDEDVAKIVAKKGGREELIAFAQKKMKNARKAMEKFASKHAGALGIQPAKGQSKKEAVRAFLADKDAQALKEAFLPSAMRRAMMYNDNYKAMLEDEFAEVFDKSKRAFKDGEQFKESVAFFKRAALNFKVKQAGLFAGIGAGIALASSAIATKIANK